MTIYTCEYGRTYVIDRVEMFKCIKCRTLFPFNRSVISYHCADCSPKQLKPRVKHVAKPKPKKAPPKPEVEEVAPEPVVEIDVISRFYDFNTDYITQLREDKRDRSSRAAQVRRAHESGVENTLTNDQWVACRLYFDNTCAYCGLAKPLAQEHFIPVSKGGGYSVSNIVPACKSCNSSKSNREYELWYVRRPYYSAERHEKIIEYLALVAN